jgi:hypothetical protein
METGPLPELSCQLSWLMSNSRASAAFESPSETRRRNSAAHARVSEMASCRCTSLPALRSQFAHADARGSAPVKVKSSPHKDDMDAPLRQTQHHSPQVIEVAGFSGYSLLRALLFLRALATGVPDTAFTLFGMCAV